MDGPRRRRARLDVHLRAEVTTAELAASTTAELRLGDWRDVLPGTYDAERAVVITDPPYGLDLDKGFVDTVPWAEHVRDVLELLPAVRHVIRGPATALVRRDHPEPRRLCVELSTFRNRATHRPRAVPYLWQGWAVYGRLAIGWRRRPPQGDARAIRAHSDIRSRNGFRQHRGITPTEAAYWIVETWSEPEMLVVDPFAGLASIGLAAAAYGLDYLGAELDPQWCEEGRDRLRNRQGRLEL